MPVSQSIAMPFSSAALARGEGFEEILVRGVSLVEEVELLVGAVQVARRLQGRHLLLRHEGHMRGGDAVPAGEFLEALGKRRLRRSDRLADAVEKAGARCRREGNGGLQLRVIAPAGALEGIGPAVVEDIFALAVVLEVGGQGAEQRPVRVLQQQVLAEPAGLGGRAARFLQRGEEGVADKGIVGKMRILPGGAGKAPPVVRRNIGERRLDADVHLPVHGHAVRGSRGSKPSNVIWSAFSAVIVRASSSRTVQVMTFRPSSRWRLMKAFGRWP